MTAMQRSFDERMGVMTNLVERDSDAVNKVAAALSALQLRCRSSRETLPATSTSSPDRFNLSTTALTN